MLPATPYRLTSDELLETLEIWDGLMSFRVKLIACSGTAMTLLGIKESTKDIDFIVPVESEYDRLMKFLKEIGYEYGGGGLIHQDDPNFIYQFFRGNFVFTTPLPEPVINAGNHTLIHRWTHIYLGALNLMDLITTKMFRGTSADVEDCTAVFKTGKVDADLLLHWYANAALHDLSPNKVMENFYYLAEKLFEKRLIQEEYVRKVKQELEEIKAKP